jgi:predicted transcriptional regulator
MKKEKPVEKKPFTIVLDQDNYDKLTKLAEKESRPRAQMARVLIERALKEEANSDK